MNIPNKEFDLVISLGGNCSAAGQLRMRGKRYEAMPFDWTLMHDTKPIEYLPRGFANQFHDICLYENVSEYEPAANEFGRCSLRLRDNLSGYCFIHHFHKPLSNRKAFEVERMVIVRRIARMYERVNKAKSVLFVLETSFEYNPDLLINLHDALKAVFPSTEIFLAAMQFSAHEYTSTMVRENIFLDRHIRPVNIVYDNQFTAPEWLWMDSLIIKGEKTAEQLRKTSLLIKWKFKLWMHLGKSLRDAGAGCANMRFRNFTSYTLAEINNP